MTEREAVSASGWLILALDIAIFLVGGLALAVGITGSPESPPLIVAGVLLVAAGGIVASGFTEVQPNVARVVVFVGRYLGTVRRNGFVWTVPLTEKPTYSLRLRNFESEILKVNDAVGNPIEVAAVVVWRVVDTARTAFEVDDYEEFVKIQTETAVRHMASSYPYDTFTDDVVSLRANAEEVTGELQRELQAHLTPIGVEVMGVQLRRLAYAPEIAADMLRRQQAEAVVAARRRIVEGAVGMVEDALERLSEKRIIQLDEERKAAMVSNLLVVLCSEHHAQPVVNAGTLYQ